MRAAAEYFHVGLANDAGPLTDRYYAVQGGSDPTVVEDAITDRVCTEFDEGTSFSSESVSQRVAKQGVRIHNLLTIMTVLRTGFAENDDPWTKPIGIEDVTINNT